MMLTTAALVVLQFIISAKAGLVNAVEGPTNVRVQQQVVAGSKIDTGPAARVELLLNPSAFLRLGENSEAVFDSVELTDIAVRLISGSAIIESASVQKDSPIRVVTGALNVSIVTPGLYRFTRNTAFVLDGELKTEDPAHATVTKGSEIRAVPGDQGTSYQESKIDASEQAPGLEEWSRQRSQQIASANSRAQQTESALNRELPLSRGQFVSPGLIPPYGYGFGFGTGIVPSISPFSSFYWYNGGYGPFQPFGVRPPVMIYPFNTYRARPMLPPVIAPRPPATTPLHPHPAPSRPGRGIAGSRR